MGFPCLVRRRLAHRDVNSVRVSRRNYMGLYLASLLVAAILLAAIHCEIKAQTPMIRVITLDESNRPEAAVRLELRRVGVVVGSAVTNDKGEAEFPLPDPGNYEIAAAKEEFETLTQADLTVAAGAPLEIRFVMVPKIKVGEKM